jgi:hypothetical protein
MLGRAKGLALLATALLLPSTAEASVTIGSNLTSAPNVVLAGGPWTVFQDPLGAEFQASGGLVSPVEGTVTEWRLRVGTPATPTTFRVIRPLGGGLYTGAGTSATVVPALNATSTFATQLPIKIGDRIGIDCCGSPGAEYFSNNSTGIRREIKPLVVNGGPGQAPVQTDNREILLNADIEPSSAFGIEQVKSGTGGKLTVTAHLPNPGTLQGGDARDKGLAAAAGKKGQLYLKQSTMAAPVAGETLNILLRPTKLTRKLLKTRAKLKAKAKLVYTPTGGSPAAQILKVKLKRLKS